MIWEKPLLKQMIIHFSQAIVRHWDSVYYELIISFVV